MSMRVYLASIDFEDYCLSHRFRFLYHRFTWWPLRPRLGLGTVAPPPSPPWTDSPLPPHLCPLLFDSCYTNAYVLTTCPIGVSPRISDNSATPCVPFGQTDTG